ncbi:hypothetical protein BV25DRAFT_1972684 [Artomyces pyxidatus]|uniref:Uncharacterized protein n=1 Tax=Artomyces pyxidatus TaxID=48021 RepID=A0ACB8SMQ4_9AGAM|nr:hypothetical protein BV25DRAFT_1972684 [Artomyces pyxidatus]
MRKGVGGGVLEPRASSRRRQLALLVGVGQSRFVSSRLVQQPNAETTRLGGDEAVDIVHERTLRRSRCPGQISVTNFVQDLVAPLLLSVADPSPKLGGAVSCCKPACLPTMHSPAATCRSYVASRYLLLGGNLSPRRYRIRGHRCLKDSRYEPLASREVVFEQHHSLFTSLAPTPSVSPVIQADSSMDSSRQSASPDLPNFPPATLQHRHVGVPFVQPIRLQTSHPSLARLAEDPSTARAVGLRPMAPPASGGQRLFTVSQERSTHRADNIFAASTAPPGLDCFGQGAVMDNTALKRKPYHQTIPGGDSSPKRFAAAAGTAAQPSPLRFAHTAAYRSEKEPASSSVVSKSSRFPVAVTPLPANVSVERNALAPHGGDLQLLPEGATTPVSSNFVHQPPVAVKMPPSNATPFTPADATAHSSKMTPELSSVVHPDLLAELHRLRSELEEKEAKLSSLQLSLQLAKVSADSTVQRIALTMRPPLVSTHPSKESTPVPNIWTLADPSVTSTRTSTPSTGVHPVTSDATSPLPPTTNGTLRPSTGTTHNTALVAAQIQFLRLEVQKRSLAIVSLSRKLEFATNPPRVAADAGEPCAILHDQQRTKCHKYAVAIVSMYVHTSGGRHHPHPLPSEPHHQGVPERPHPDLPAVLARLQVSPVANAEFVGACAAYVRCGVEHADATEGGEGPGEDIGVGRVQRGPERAAEDGDRWRNVVPRAAEVDKGPALMTMELATGRLHAVSCMTISTKNTRLTSDAMRTEDSARYCRRGPDEAALLCSESDLR